MFETREELILLYLPFSFIILLLNPEGKIHWWRGKALHKAFFLFMIGSLIATAYYFRSEYDSLIYERLGNYAFGDYFFGLILIVFTFYLTFSEYGKAIPILALISLIYAYWGNLFPGFLYHQGMSITRIIAVSSTEFNAGDGVLGALPQIGITWIGIFSIYAGIAFAFGVLDYIMKVSYKFFNKYRYGIPQIAVVASLVFGTFSGSGAANVAGTGSFTIPLMKKYGLPSYIAGAIESVASSGGQVMPPVMGAAAFLMASYLGMYYWQVVLIGFLPALIFYFCTALSVYILSLQFMTDIVKIEENSIQANLTRLEIFDGLPLVVSIIVLFLGMSVFLVDVMVAGFFMIVSFLTIWLIWQLFRLSVQKRFILISFFEKLILGIKRGAEGTASITVMLSCIGIIVAVLIQSGLAQKLSFAIVNIAGGNKILLIFLVTGLCILFGMACSTVATYILTVTLAAPVLLNMGVPLLITHFFVFYVSMLGLITPPVAPCCAVASGLARADFIKICWYSMKIGFPLFILPLAFYNNPSFIIFGTGTVTAVLFITFGMFALTFGINLSYNNFQTLFKKLIYCTFGLVTIFSYNLVIQYISLFICVVFVIFEFYKLRPQSEVLQAKSEIPV
jgi:TRAP transporter 4TM/12TM fusion protein